MQNIDFKYVFLLFSAIFNLINTFINSELLFSISIGLALCSVVYYEFTMFDKK